MVCVPCSLLRCFTKDSWGNNNIYLCEAVLRSRSHSFGHRISSFILSKINMDRYLKWNIRLEPKIKLYIWYRYLNKNCTVLSPPPSTEPEPPKRGIPGASQTSAGSTCQVHVTSLVWEGGPLFVLYPHISVHTGIPVLLVTFHSQR